MATGRIISYDEDRGHGLIEATDEPERLSFSTGAFEDEGRPFEGQRVTFEVEQSRAGPRATHVHPVKHHETGSARSETAGESMAEDVREMARSPDLDEGPDATVGEPQRASADRSEGASPDLDELRDDDEPEGPIIEDGKDRPHGGP